MKAITTKYHGQTNTKPARVTAYCEGVYVWINSSLTATVSV